MTFAEAIVWSTIRDLVFLTGMGVLVVWGWKSFKRRQSLRKGQQQTSYVTALEELENGTRDRGIWAAMLVKAEGDRGRAEALYMRVRSNQISQSAIIQTSLPPAWSWMKRVQEAPKWRLNFNIRQAAKLTFLFFAIYTPLTSIQILTFMRDLSDYTVVDLTDIRAKLNNTKNGDDRLRIVRTATSQLAVQLGETDGPLDLTLSALGTWLPGRAAIDAIQLASGDSVALGLNLYDIQRLYSISSPDDRLKLLPWILDRVTATTDNPQLRKKYFETIVSLRQGTILEATAKSEVSSIFAFLFLVWLAKPNFLIRREPET